MSSALTLHGIDQAISNLGYKSAGSPKARLILAIRECYTNPATIETLQQIAPDALIRKIWGNCGSAAELRSRCKNLASVRSSVNADLKKRFDSGRNPEGITIGSAFVFVMSDDAKERLLSSLARALQPEQSLSLTQIADMLAVAGQHLKKMGLQGSEKNPNGLEDLKAVISSLGGLVGSGGFSPPSPGASFTDADASAADAKHSGCRAVDLSETGTPSARPGRGVDGPGDLARQQLEEKAAPCDLAEMAPPPALDAAVDTSQAGLAQPPEAEDQLLELVDIIDELDEIVETEEVDETEEVEEVDETEEVGEFDETEEVDEIVEAAEGEGDFPADRPCGSDSPTAMGIGLPLDPLEQAGDDMPIDPEDLRSHKLLAENFDGYLGVMERYYNQYLLVAEEKYVIGSQNPLKGELKAHTIQLPAFYMGKFPVTNALFEVFVDRTGYVTTAEKRGEAAVYRGRFQKALDPETGRVRSVWHTSHRREVVKGACWYQPFGPGSALHAKRNHPVVQVSLQDALAFAAWTGKRLPREAEWEAAARTGAGLLLPWGRQWLEDRCNTEETGIADTTPVDRFAEGANALGISDCLGNVLEWTLDASPPLFEGSGQPDAFIAKGGSWISENSVRLYSRFRFPADFCANILGFRCLAE
ncbi:MAG: SUMF1/EgtB/PvdO family nonheme iron enzyme [Desulfobacterales bacterium]|nr:SUMF1/EgtB/PvdO family nonheme iron enzyme [Desulfobacterales bacterium]